MGIRSQKREETTPGTNVRRVKGEVEAEKRRRRRRRRKWRFCPRVCAAARPFASAVS